MADGPADVEALQRELALLRAEAAGAARAAAAAAMLERQSRAIDAVTRALADASAEPAGSAESAEDLALPAVLAALGAALGCALAGYWVPDGETLACRATWCAADVPPAAAAAWEAGSRALRLQPGESPPGLAWRTGAPARLADVPPEALPRRPLYDDIGIGGGVAFPVTAGGAVLGAIELFARAPEPLGPGLDPALRAIGDHVGQLVRYARAEAQRRALEARDAALAAARQAAEALDAEREALVKLYELGRTLSGELDPAALAQVFADVATRVTGAQRGAFFYRADLDDDAGAGAPDASEMRCATSGITREELAALPMPRDTPLLGPTFTGRTPLRVDDVTRDPRYGKNSPHRGLPAAHFPVRSYLAVPVRSRSGRVLGAMLLGHERIGAFDDRAQRLVTGLASHAATAMDNAALFASQQRLIESLERTNAELDQFSYAASHDLRAPLRGITNLATWIEEDLGAATPKKVRELLALLRGRAARMDRLIIGLLELARVGRVRQRPERVDVTELLHDTIDLLSPPATARILIVGAMPTLVAERVALQQVFLNLIGNALQHSGRKDVVVRITCTERADEVELSVADDGVGIPAELQAQCWEVFQTLQSRDIVDSTGMGLAIVKKQVESNGGRAWFVAHPKQGTDVRFTWPKRTR